MTNRSTLLGTLCVLALAFALPAFAAKPTAVKPRAAQALKVPPKTQELDKSTPILYGKQPASTARESKPGASTPKGWYTCSGGTCESGVKSPTPRADGVYSNNMGQGLLGAKAEAPATTGQAASTAGGKPPAAGTIKASKSEIAIESLEVRQSASGAGAK